MSPKDSCSSDDDKPNGAWRKSDEGSDGLEELLREFSLHDSYDMEALALGSVLKKDFLRLPIGLHLPNIDSKLIGKPNNGRVLSPDEAAQIYILNRNECPSTIRLQRVKFGILRLALVQAGWSVSGKGVCFVAPVLKARRSMSKDLPIINEVSSIARTLSLILPLTAENVFRTMGHRYLSASSETYENKYKDLFSACICPELVSYLDSQILFRTVAHWVPMQEAYRVLCNEENANTVPEVMRMSSYMPPSNVSIICKIEEITRVMISSGFEDMLNEEYPGLTKVVADMGAKIRNDPASYHMVRSAYGLGPMRNSELIMLDNAMEAAQTLSPVCEEYIRSSNPLFNRDFEHELRDLAHRKRHLKAGVIRRSKYLGITWKD